MLVLEGLAFTSPRSLGHLEQLLQPALLLVALSDRVEQPATLALARLDLPFLAGHRISQPVPLLRDFRQPHPIADDRVGLTREPAPHRLEPLAAETALPRRELEQLRDQAAAIRIVHGHARFTRSMRNSCGRATTP